MHTSLREHMQVVRKEHFRWFSGGYVQSVLMTGGVVPLLGSVVREEVQTEARWKKQNMKF